MQTEPPTLYHGTRVGFQRGGLVMPRTFHNAKPTTAPLKSGHTLREDSKHWVYCTTSKILAWVYAFHSTGRGRPRVLTIRPLSDVYPDPEHSEDMEAYRVEAAIVESVDFEAPITEAEAREGWQN